MQKNKLFALIGITGFSGFLLLLLGFFAFKNYQDNSLREQREKLQQERIAFDERLKKIEIDGQKNLAEAQEKYMREYQKEQAKIVNPAKGVTVATSSSGAPAGWNPASKPGIFWKWCAGEPECSTAKIYREALRTGRFRLLLVYCKETACGDVYAKLNLTDANGTSVGWTNDTGYGALGQKVLLTFQSTSSNWVNAELVELNFHS